VAERPRRRDPDEVGPPSGCRRSEDVRTPARPGVALSARPVRRGMSVQPVERTSSIQVSGVQASGASRCPAGQALVSAAVPSRCPRRAGPRVLGDGPPRPGAGGRRAAAVGGRRGRLPASGRMGRGWCGGGRGWLARGRPQPRAAAWPASRLRRRLGPGGPTWALGPGCRPVAGSPGQSRCSPAPQGVLAGRRRGGRPWAWTRRW
jgi:hypothetical protein